MRESFLVRVSGVTAADTPRCRRFADSLRLRWRVKGPPCGDVVPIPLIGRAGNHDVRRGGPPLVAQRADRGVGLTPRDDVAYPPPSCGRLGSGERVDAVGEGDPVQLGDESFGFGERPAFVVAGANP